MESKPAQAKPPATMASLTLYVAMVTMGLMAGLFYAWDVSVMPGLARLDDRTFLGVMQILIAAIENLAFYVVVVGALGFTAAAAMLAHRRGHLHAARWIWGALALYAVALAITMAVHLPLNYALVDAGDPGQITDPAGVRNDFETPWRIANVARTVNLHAGADLPWSGAGAGCPEQGIAGSRVIEPTLLVQTNCSRCQVEGPGGPWSYGLRSR